MAAGHGGITAELAISGIGLDRGLYPQPPVSQPSQLAAWRLAWRNLPASSSPGNQLAAANEAIWRRAGQPAGGATVAV
jgi:hypothetical protein